MLTTSKPIIFEATMPIRNEYMPYTIEASYASNGAIQYYTIYNGKTFVDGTYNTKITAEKILRDFVYRWGYRYDYDTQRMVPENLKTNFTTQMSPIEHYESNRFINARFKVTINDTVIEKNVTGASVPLYQSAINELPEADDTTTTDIVSYSSLSTGCIPHIPFVSTNKFWLGLSFYETGRYKALYITRLSCRNSTRSINLNVADAGSYALSIPLSTLFSTFQSDDATLYIGNGIQLRPSDEIRKAVAIVDICPKRYYVSWITPTCGWQCYGFDGNAVISNSTDNDEITDIYGDQKVIWTNSRCKFNLYTKYLSREEYCNLMGIPSSNVIYLYDTENDRGTYVVCKNNSIDSIPSKNYKPKDINFQFEEVRDTIK